MMGVRFLRPRIGRVLGREYCVVGRREVAEDLNGGRSARMLRRMMAVMGALVLERRALGRALRSLGKGVYLRLEEVMLAGEMVTWETRLESRSSAS